MDLVSKVVVESNSPNLFSNTEKWSEVSGLLLHVGLAFVRMKLRLHKRWVLSKQINHHAPVLTAVNVSPSFTNFMPETKADWWLTFTSILPPSSLMSVI